MKEAECAGLTPHLTAGRPVLTLPDAIASVLFPFAMLFQTEPGKKLRSYWSTRYQPRASARWPRRCVSWASAETATIHTRYHHVLNRAAWSPLGASQVLPRLLLQHLDHGDNPLVFGTDETLERLRVLR